MLCYLNFLKIFTVIDEKLILLYNTVIYAMLLWCEHGITINLMFKYVFIIVLNIIINYYLLKKYTKEKKNTKK